ncbi:MAG: hypothetical protein IAG13_11985 [Deltaproteobacteria bacterium]|nr:hypothetical protein [Nannocystaceae bacterium]
MASSSRSRRAPFVVMLVLACQRLELAEDDGALTLQGGSGDTSSGGSTFGADDTTSESEGGNDSNDTTEPAFDCDPVLQTGCNPQEKCTVVIASGDLGYVCASDPGDLDPFESCEQSLSSGIDGCPAGYACVADELESGLCVPLCIDSNDCTDASCVNDPLNFIPHCGAECSPFEGACPQPLQCRRGDDRFACEFTRSGDVGGQNEPCATMGDAGCAEGFVCLPGALVPECTTDNCCTGVCDVQEDTCPSPSSCQPLFNGPAPGFESFGGCLVPA